MEPGGPFLELSKEKTVINISKLTKAEVLSRLYNGARPFGMGFLQAKEEDMTLYQATNILKDRKDDHYFDYLQGRLLKVDLSSDEELDPRLYDRDHGTGAAEHALFGDKK